MQNESLVSCKIGSDTAENGPSKDWATNPALDPTILPRSSKHLCVRVVAELVALDGLLGVLEGVLEHEVGVPEGARSAAGVAALGNHQRRFFRRRFLDERRAGAKRMRLVQF